MKIEGITVVNVYKPPNKAIKQFYSGLCFSLYIRWRLQFPLAPPGVGYQSTNPSSETLEDWTLAADLQLLYDPKQSDSFHSGRWNSTTTQDLAFANISSSPERLALNSFPKSQHRPSLILPVNPIRPIPSKAVKRWNFRRANWLRFTRLVDIKIRRLPEPASSDLHLFAKFICKDEHLPVSAKFYLRQEKRIIPRGYCRRFIPTWDEKCDSHYEAIMFSKNSKETTQTTTDVM